MVDGCELLSICSLILLPQPGGNFGERLLRCELLSICSLILLPQLSLASVFYFPVVNCFQFVH